MKKCIMHMLVTLLVVIGLALGPCSNSYAYTEEQIAQAKAWLSAHGYSPDSGGASQAYQDYLNGKFDEELGQDINGDGIPATTGASTQAQDNTAQNGSQSGTNEKEANSQKESGKQENSENTGNDPADEKDATGDGNAGNDSGESSSTQEDGTDNETSVSGDADEDSQPSGEDGQDKNTDGNEVEDTQENSESDSGEEKQTQSYGDAIVAIVIGILCMCAVVFLLSLRRTKE